ncbi:MAG: HNH endonuclease [Bryobacteraceae bacterium]
MELLFHRVYEMADLMAYVVDVGDAFDELDWNCAQVSVCLNRFSKSSLLAHFCFTYIRMHDLKTARKDPEDMNVEDMESAFKKYAIPFITFKDFICREFPDERDDDYIEYEALYSWMHAQEDGAFGLLWEKMTDEVFQLLFGNRGFLLNFNLQLAQFRQERGDTPSPRCFIPQWVKRAIYFRENGKCALCKKDLSGLIAIDPKQHYDHMVPLKALGTNDPCNMQLLCERCNLLKAASPARTSSVYDPWWK